MQNFYCYHKNVDILNQAKPCKRVFKLIKDFERYSGTKACILITGNITMKPNINTRSAGQVFQIVYNIGFYNIEVCTIYIKSFEGFSR